MVLGFVRLVFVWFGSILEGFFLVWFGVFLCVYSFINEIFQLTYQFP